MTIAPIYREPLLPQGVHLLRLPGERNPRWMDAQKRLESDSRLGATILSLHHLFVSAPSLLQSWTTNSELARHPFVLDLQAVVSAKGADGVAVFLQQSRISAAMFMPCSCSVLEVWASALVSRGVRPIVTCYMECTDFLADDGGYWRDTAPSMIADSAARLGLVDFGVTGEKEDIDRRRKYLQSVCGDTMVSMYCPVNSEIPLANEPNLHLIY